MNHERMTSQAHPTSARHEGTGVNSWVIALSAIGLIIVVASSLLIARSTLHLLTPVSRTVTADVPKPTPSMGVPLDAHERQTRLAYEQAQQERLSSYGWSDRSRGKVRIPINRAMAIVVEKDGGRRD